MYCDLPGREVFRPSLLEDDRLPTSGICSHPHGHQSSQHFEEPGENFYPPGAQQLPASSQVFQNPRPCANHGGQRCIHCPLFPSFSSTSAFPWGLQKPLSSPCLYVFSFIWHFFSVLSSIPLIVFHPQSC